MPIAESLSVPPVPEVRTGDHGRRHVRSVVHVAPALFGDRGVVGGGERYPYELARAMSGVVPTTLVCYGAQDATETDGSLRIRIIGNAWKIRGQVNNPLSLRLVPEIIGADVVHCYQQHILNSSFTAMVRRMLGRRVCVSDLGGGGWDISGYLSTDRWYHGHLHISEYSRRVSGHENNPRAHAIFGGVDVDKFSPLPADAGIADAYEPFVLYVGRVLPHKGIDDVIRALPPGLALKIVGRQYHPQYADDLRQLAEGKRVRFLPDCSDAEVIDHYRRALCVILPSVYRTMYGEYSNVPELLGQTLLEGMACETPAICTDVASMPEIVQHEQTGFVVPPGDVAELRRRLEWLHDHPARAREMGRQARRHVRERFTWGRVVDQCLRIYEKW